MKLGTGDRLKDFLGVLCLAGAVVFLAFPYWLALIITIVFCLAFVPFMVRQGVKDTTLPKFRRFAYVVLGIAYLIAAMDAIWLISKQIGEYGWLGRFR